MQTQILVPVTYDCMWISLLTHRVHIFQIANHLDRAVNSLGREPLKVLVQVNTSGEECECRINIDKSELLSLD